MSWYYVLHGQRQGPVSQADFEQLVADGVVTSETLVSLDAMATWQPYAVVRPVSPAGDEGTEICVMSGRRCSRNQMIQYEGQWISAEHRDAFFERLSEGVRQPLVGEFRMPGPYGYGGFWRRAGALVIDVVIRRVLVYLLSIGVTALIGSGVGLGFTDLRAYLVMDLAITLVVHLAYGIFFLRRFDATPGKLALGLKVLRPDGSSLSVSRIVGRYFAGSLNLFTLGIGYLVVTLNAEKRGLHDYLCDTRVIRVR